MNEDANRREVVGTGAGSDHPFKDIRKERQGAITASDRRIVGERMAKKKQEARAAQACCANDNANGVASDSGDGVPPHATSTSEAVEGPLRAPSQREVDLNQSPPFRWDTFATKEEETIEEFGFRWASETERNVASQLLGVDNNVATENADAENVDSQRGRSSSCTSAIASKRAGASTPNNESDASHDVSGGTECNKKKKAKDMSWLLTGSRDGGTGGPYDTCVIPSFCGHIACALWEDPVGNDRGVLTPYTRERTLNSLEKLTLKDEVAMGFVTSSGLSLLPQCMMRNLDLPLLSAFVERWQPNTNTFHMPFGEMTILLHDVFFILWIPVDGEVCSGVYSPGGLVNDIAELLGICTEELSDPWVEGRSSTQIYRSGGVFVSALQHVTENQTHPMLAAQGYLLLLLGSTLFVDKSSDRIHSTVNTLLKDVSKVKTYAWGTGCLAYMYRHLGVASRAEAKGICGCLTLLQAWIYEYFPCFRPSSTFAIQLDKDAPRASMWGSGRRGSLSDKGLLKDYRTMIDKLVVEQVDWLPYNVDVVREVPVSRFHGTIRFVDVIECYHPDRCLRQFGFKQTIPTLVMTPQYAYRSPRQSMYDVKFPEWSDVLWQNKAGHILVLSTLSSPAQPPHAHAPDYLEWWRIHSHPHIVNSVRSRSRKVQSLSTSTEGQAANAHVLAVLGAFERIAPALLIPQDQRPPGLEELWKQVDEIAPILRQCRGRSEASTSRTDGHGTSGTQQ